MSKRRFWKLPRTICSRRRRGGARRRCPARGFGDFPPDVEKGNNRKVFRFFFRVFTTVSLRLFYSLKYLRNNIRIAHKCYIAHTVCFVDTAFGETGFGKKVQMFVFIGEQSAALRKDF